MGLENLDELNDKVIRNDTEIWGRVIETNDPDALVQGKERHSDFYMDVIRDIPSSEILGNGKETKLTSNKIRIK